MQTPRALDRDLDSANIIALPSLVIVLLSFLDIPQTCILEAGLTVNLSID